MTTIKQPFQCNLPPQLQETHRTTHTGTTTRCKTRRRNNSRQKTTAAAPRRTHEVPFIVACSHFTRKNNHKVLCSRFLPNSPLAFVTASLPHHFPSSPHPIVTTSHRHHVPSSPPPFVHFPSSPLPFLTTSHRPQLPLIMYCYV